MIVAATKLSAASCDFVDESGVQEKTIHEITRRVPLVFDAGAPRFPLSDVTEPCLPSSQLTRQMLPTFVNEKLRKRSGMGRLLLVITLCAGVALGQQNAGSLKGQVSDEFGGVIVGAHVVAINQNGAEKSVTTNGEGNFVLNGLAPGKYTIKVTAIGFAKFENADVESIAGRSQQLNVTLKVTIEQQKVTVAADSAGVNTDPENNVGAIVL